LSLKRGPSLSCAFAARDPPRLRKADPPPRAAKRVERDPKSVLRPSGEPEGVRAEPMSSSKDRSAGAIRHSFNIPDDDIHRLELDTAPSDVKAGNLAREPMREPAPNSL
jgi:hypothetical protein